MTDKCEYFMNQINNLLNGDISSDLIIEMINKNFKERENNEIFYYLSQYSLEKYCNLNYDINKNIEIIKDEKSNILNYSERIKLAIFLITEELKCDNITNKKQLLNLLKYTIDQKNYYIALEFLDFTQNTISLSKVEYRDILRLLIKSGDCLRDDCIELISYISKKNNIIDKQYLNFKNQEIEPFLLSLCKDFSNNIYDKYNEIVKMKCIKYLKKDKSGIYTIPIDNNIIEKIKTESKEKFDKFIYNKFEPLLNYLIKLGANPKYIDDNNLSIPILFLLITYPFFKDISLFIEKNEIDISVKDKLGRSALMHLINNKKK